MHVCVAACGNHDDDDDDYNDDDIDAEFTETNNGEHHDIGISIESSRNGKGC